MTQHQADIFVERVRAEVVSFVSSLDNYDLSEFWAFNVDEFRTKLEKLNEMQNFRLHFTLKKYFWESDKHQAQADALCAAGFFSRDALPFAQRTESLDNRRRLARAISERRS
jgi:hypothetical protein